MTNDFDQTRDAFAGSVIGRIFASLNRAGSNAWRTSATGRAARSMAVKFEAMPKASRLATIAAAVAIAAGVQPLLVQVMPKTVVPALPWPVFAIVAVFAAAAAWQAEPIVTAWQDSRLAGWLRR